MLGAGKREQTLGYIEGEVGGGHKTDKRFKGGKVF